MQHFGTPQPIGSKLIDPDQHLSERQVTIADFLSSLRRQWLAIVGCIVLALGFGMVCFLTTPSTYTSYTSIMIDSRRSLSFSPVQSALAEGILDSTGVESQIEVLRSDSTVFAVIDKLRLVDQLELLAGQPDLVSVISDGILR